MEMTKEYLEAYKSKKEEIRELRYKLDHLCDGDNLIGNDTVFDYRTGYPQPQSVVGYDQDKEWRLRNLYTTKIARLLEECTETETWVEGIPDSLTRRIFRMYFLDGLSQKTIAKRAHLDQSRISRRIYEFLKNA
ncbi:MAG: hypothetical protein PHR92_18105 [Lachnospiraceae bacterium]|nr:hypothetical protein [Lachnospiraceae bacterium]